MYKGESPEVIVLTPKTSMQVYIDQDDVAMCKLCTIENGVPVCQKPVVISMGPVTQIVGGVVFCLAYEKEKSLLVPIVIHMLGNAALFTLGLL